jgi:Cu(I)/Ag(I) efflux system membrane fusion protein
MKKLAILLLITIAYIAGFGYGRWYAKPVSAAGAPARKVLYWVDSMHPWYKSDKPGIAPDCGMKLVPVYEGEENRHDQKLPQGTVQISPDKQKLIGV